MLRLELHPEATRELDDAATWYLTRSGVAAKGFALAVDVAIGKIRNDPDRFPRVDRRHRACNLENYPFQIIFRRNDERLFVVAVAHAKRRPGYWRSRLTGSP